MCLLLLGASLAGGLPPEARAQVWSADLSAGRIVYDPVSIDAGAANLTGTLRYDTARDTWIYGSAASPLGQQAPFWGATGAGGRFVPGRARVGRMTFGADLGVHGYLFRDRVVDQGGVGGTLDATPFARLDAGGAHVEVRSGWRGQTLSYAGSRQRRSVTDTGVRVGMDTPLRVQGDARWVSATEGTFPFVGVSAAYGRGSWSVWGQAGRWLSDALDDPAWATGSSYALTGRASLWASVRQEAPDPLYWNAARRTWSVGVTQKLGLGRSSARVLAPPRAQPGGVVIRVPVADAIDGAVSVAGSFNNWRPVPMQREGREWVIRLPLTAGRYEYAFRSADGEWFVPASVPGRRTDGMGGHVAVLVVL
jgi:hypothetical protein